ncbi:uncharacterized protein V1516DRAFT_24025 [Lipomyces oligophaga]|uniref:uncharacterized protein n=1 Tax=Lipomyces oligophaga TaxID=45792 RepID=UPI0034CE55D4
MTTTGVIETTETDNAQQAQQHSQSDKPQPSEEVIWATKHARILAFLDTLPSPPANPPELPLRNRQHTVPEYLLSSRPEISDVPCLPMSTARPANVPIPRTLSAAKSCSDIKKLHRRAQYFDPIDSDQTTTASSFRPHKQFKLSPPRRPMNVVCPPLLRPESIVLQKQVEDSKPEEAAIRDFLLDQQLPDHLSGLRISIPPPARGSTSVYEVEKSPARVVTEDDALAAYFDPSSSEASASTQSSIYGSPARACKRSSHCTVHTSSITGNISERKINILPVRIAGRSSRSEQRLTKQPSVSSVILPGGPSLRHLSNQSMIYADTFKEPITGVPSCDSRFKSVWMNPIPDSDSDLHHHHHKQHQYHTHDDSTTNSSSTDRTSEFQKDKLEEFKTNNVGGLSLRVDDCDENWNRSTSTANTSPIFQDMSTMPIIPPMTFSAFTSQNTQSGIESVSTSSDSVQPLTPPQRSNEQLDLEPTSPTGRRKFSLQDTVSAFRLKRKMSRDVLRMSASDTLSSSDGRSTENLPHTLRTSVSSVGLSGAFRKMRLASHSDSTVMDERITVPVITGGETLVKSVSERAAYLGSGVATTEAATNFSTTTTTSTSKLAKKRLPRLGSRNFRNRGKTSPTTGLHHQSVDDLSTGYFATTAV